MHETAATHPVMGIIGLKTKNHYKINVILVYIYIIKIVMMGVAMARDMKEAVYEACNRLLGQGEWPVVESVRAAIGSGSATTINRYLKEWRAGTIDAMVQHKNAAGAQFAGVPEEIAMQAVSFWESATKLASSKFDLQIAEVEEERLGWLSEMQEMSRQSELKDDQLRDANARIVQLQQSLTRAETRLAVEKEARQLAEGRAVEAIQDARDARDAERLANEECLRLVDMANQRAEALARSAEERAGAAIADARIDAERREALAYERLEGVRVRLYEDVDRERREMAIARQQLIDAHSQAVEKLRAEETRLRLRLADLDRQVAAKDREIKLLSALTDDAKEEVKNLHQRIEGLLSQRTSKNDEIDGENDDEVAEKITSIVRSLVQEEQRTLFDLSALVAEEFGGAVAHASLASTLRKVLGHLVETREMTLNGGYYRTA
ncbi:DNA-binding protein [Vogesella sp. XCS3]|uniref:DNA-binding protein n=1 Tax=Vogesella sp. XCS3 TaxID=2877939 RepID=UPI001D0BCD87|nr:DNA-binding protein [Vogesella sp. XCS3]UDM18945.1 DNA-binding protein [Vogesella sp. XCS3]